MEACEVTEQQVRIITTDDVLQVEAGGGGRGWGPTHSGDSLRQTFRECQVGDKDPCHTTHMKS